jgi:hypothetical protein
MTLRASSGTRLTIKRKETKRQQVFYDKAVFLHHKKPIPHIVLHTTKQPDQGLLGLRENGCYG